MRKLLLTLLLLLVAVPCKAQQQTTSTAATWEQGPAGDAVDPYSWDFYGDGIYLFTIPLANATLVFTTPFVDRFTVAMPRQPAGMGLTMRACRGDALPTFCDAANESGLSNMILIPPDATATPSVTQTATKTITSTATPTATATHSTTQTAIRTMTTTSTSKVTHTATPSATVTRTPTATETRTLTPTRSPTPIPPPAAPVLIEVTTSFGAPVTVIVRTMTPQPTP